jgi:hypothetical protein
MKRTEDEILAIVEFFLIAIAGGIMLVLAISALSGWWAK